MSDEHENNPLIDRANGGGKDPATGRFTAGNKLARGGDPHAAKIKEYRKAIYDAVSHHDIHAIIQKAVQQARDGDKSAREFLFDRLLGKATQVTELNLDAGNILKTYLGVNLEGV